MPAAAALIALAPPATAATSIIADRGVNGLGTKVTTNGPDATISGGTLRGANLFHSFKGFDLGTGGTARWVVSGGDAAKIANVINRVTGGGISHISGTLDSTALPNAAFWFINPAGIVFGPGAAVNVSGAAHFTTAEQLRFADGAVFRAVAPGGSTLSVASPASFGFLGGQGDIHVGFVGPAFLRPDGVLALAGRNITIADSRFLAAKLDLAAIGRGKAALAIDAVGAEAASGILAITDTQIVVAPFGSGNGMFHATAGNVTMDHARLTVTSSRQRPGAAALIRSRSFTLRNTSRLASVTRSAQSSGDIAIAADHLLIADGSSVQTASLAGGQAGDIHVAAGQIQLTGGTLESHAGVYGDEGNDDATGNAGDIDVTAGAIDVRNDAAGNIGLISSQAAAGSGDAGDIAVKADALTVRGGGIASVTFTVGHGGDVALAADRIVIGGDAAGDGGFVVSEAADGTGDAGTVAVKAGVLTVNGGSIGSGTITSGNAGDVMIDARRIAIGNDAAGNIGMIVSQAADGTGNAGTLAVKTDMLTIRGGMLDTSTASAGRAGDVVIDAGRIDLGNDADGNIGAITSRAEGGTGDAGTVSVRAEVMTVRGGTVGSDTSTSGHAGDIVVTTDKLLLGNAADGTIGTITSQALDGTGDAGRVSVKVGMLTIRGGSLNSSTQTAGKGGDVLVDAGSIFLGNAAAGPAGTIASRAAAGIGDAGRVSVRADVLTISGGSLDSETVTSGKAGTVTVDAGRIMLGNDARKTGLISSRAQAGSGDAGNVSVRAGVLTIRGGSVDSATFTAGRAGAVVVHADTLYLGAGGGKTGFITSRAQAGTGDAGNVAVTADVLNIRGGSLDSSTSTSGRAGSVAVDAGTIYLGGDDAGNVGFITSRAQRGTGDGGNVSVKADVLTIGRGSLDSSTFTSGNAGNVTLRAGTLEVSPAGRLSTSSFGSGHAGDIVIRAGSIAVAGGIFSEARAPAGSAGRLDLVAGRLAVRAGGQIDTVSTNASTAGQIAIRARAIRVDGAGAAISSSNSGGGAAGSIALAAGRITIANGGSVATDASAGAAGDIGIAMLSDGFLFLNGTSAPGTITTSSGSGTGGRITIADPFAIISNHGSILALGAAGGANVAIRAQFFIRSSDYPNLLAVNGALVLDSQLGDLSSGTTVTDVSFLDASKVLQGQCPAARLAGGTSQLSTRAAGPFSAEEQPAIWGFGGCS